MRTDLFLSLLFWLLIFSSGCRNESDQQITQLEESQMYKTYKVQKITTPVEIDADWNKPVWQEIQAITLENFMGDEPAHRPRTEAKLAWGEEYIYVIFRVEDRYVRAVATEYHGRVWEDSCVEFFFTPAENTDQGYFNLETNCIGTILMHHQKAGGQDKVEIAPEHLGQIKIATSFPKGEPIDPEITEPITWTLEYALPWRMLKNYTDVAAPEAGVKWRSNFYKCADKTSHPHWLTWSKIPLEQPNFHLPGYFGFLEFVE